MKKIFFLCVLLVHFTSISGLRGFILSKKSPYRCTLFHTCCTCKCKNNWSYQLMLERILRRFLLDVISYWRWEEGRRDTLDSRGTSCRDATYIRSSKWYSCTYWQMVRGDCIFRCLMRLFCAQSKLTIDPLCTTAQLEKPPQQQHPAPVNYNQHTVQSQILMIGAVCPLNSSCYIFLLSQVAFEWMTIAVCVFLQL